MYAAKFKEHFSDSEVVDENSMAYFKILKMFQEADGEIEMLNKKRDILIDSMKMLLEFKNEN